MGIGETAGEGEGGRFTETRCLNGIGGNGFDLVDCVKMSSISRSSRDRFGESEGEAFGSSDSFSGSGKAIGGVLIVLPFYLTGVQRNRLVKESLRPLWYSTPLVTRHPGVRKPTARIGFSDNPLSLIGVPHDRSQRVSLQYRR